MNSVIILLIATILSFSACATQNTFRTMEQGPDEAVERQGLSSSPAEAKRPQSSGPQSDVIRPGQSDEQVKSNPQAKAHEPSSQRPWLLWSRQSENWEETTEQAVDNTETASDKPDQAIFDSALEFCQTSTDLWDKGDLDGAISALDQAYALILTVDLKRSPELLQQVEDLRFTISKRIVEIYSSRHTTVNGYHTAIPMVINKHVENALNQLKGPERNFFINAYQRSGKYRPFIVKALKDAGLPEELSWLPLIESGFKARALSPARALGLWQFIASTGYKYGLKRGTWVDERMDPEKSTMAAIEYLKELHQIFGDWTTALAAYNCGEGAVLRFLKTQRINYLDNFWDLYEKLPQETASYVPRFLATLHIIGNPAAHGFDLPPLLEAIPAEKVTVNRPIHLKTIASHLSVPFEVLVELNPELREDVTPDRPYDLRVPAGTGLLFLAKASDMEGWSPSAVGRYSVHTVKKGETIYSIARRYNTTPGAIVKLNSLPKGLSTKLASGSEIKIPSSKKRPAVTAAASSAPVAKAGGSCPPSYTVKKGDTISRIARMFGTTPAVIRKANGLKNDRLSIGQVLTLKEAAPAAQAAPRTYKVVKGDSPSTIALKHDMSVYELLRINNLTPESTIYPGQVLVVGAN
jgi:membrane-bound lytic murein transglycosylase D